MPPSVVSQLEKSKLITRLQGLVPRLRPFDSHRQYWLVSRTQHISVFITFSQLHNGKNGFYDINPEDLNNWMAFSKAFVAFVLGSSQDVALVPARRMKEIIQKHKIRLSGRGDYKLNLVVSSSGIEIREAPGENLQVYRNHFDQIIR